MNKKTPRNNAGSGKDSYKKKNSTPHSDKKDSKQSFRKKPTESRKKDSDKENSKSFSKKSTDFRNKTANQPISFEKRGPSFKKEFKKEDSYENRKKEPDTKKYSKNKPTDQPGSFEKKAPSFKREDSYENRKKEHDSKKDDFYGNRKRDAGSKPSFRKKDETAPKKEFGKKSPSFKKEDSYGNRQSDTGSKPSFRKKDETAPKKEFGKKSPSFSNSKGDFKKKPTKDSTIKVDPPKYYTEKPFRSKKGTTPSPSLSDEIRLNRFISNAGVCSRREADTLIGLGEITVNGKVVTELGYKVSKSDVVKYNNKALNPEKLIYVLLNKPKDFITTTEDPQERKTVMALVENACKERIYPVGRLDRNTTGLLLLTNDGDLAKKLTHPSSNVKKLYQVDLNKPLLSEDFEKIIKGLTLEDGKVFVDGLAYVSQDKTSLGIEIHEGRNRIVRRIFEHLGYDVVKLDRVMYAGLTKKDLPRGKWKFLTPKELIQLKHFL